jgi:hydroxyacylglutathione hydrolase
MIDVFAQKISGLGNRSYLATDRTVAIVVDPPRDVDRTIALAGLHGVDIALVLDTHVHNDYVSGALELARITGARYVLAAGEAVGFAGERVGVEDGDVLEAGTMRITAVHTPGHTDHHFSYLLSDVLTGKVVALFSGGSWLQGSAGRTDLTGAEHTDRLARAQWRSVRRLAALVPDDVRLCPTHGFGSFCAPRAIASAANPTIGTERPHHPALTQTEETFVEGLVRGFGSYPMYYARMAPMNRRGPNPIDLRRPAEVQVSDLPDRIAAGDWVVDLRARKRFAAGHITGSINVEAGDSFATYLGWILPAGTPLALVGESPKEVAAAQRALARIGIDRPVAQATISVDRWGDDVEIRTYPIATFADLAAARAAGRPAAVLDVRADEEWKAAHLSGARHCPVGDVPERVDDVVSWANGATVWVHCTAGFRASIAASLLDRRGIPVVLIDDLWDNLPAPPS